MNKIITALSLVLATASVESAQQHSYESKGRFGVWIAGVECAASYDNDHHLDPLIVALESGTHHTLKDFIAAGASFERYKKCAEKDSIIKKALASKNVEKLKIVLDAGVDPHEELVRSKTRILGLGMFVDKYSIQFDPLEYIFQTSRLSFADHEILLAMIEELVYRGVNEKLSDCARKSFETQMQKVFGSQALERIVARVQERKEEESWVILS